MMYGYGYGPDFGFFHLINTVLWILFIVFIFKMIRNRRAVNGGTGNNRWSMPWQNKGLDVLNERFAKGEITKEEYEEKKKVLMS